MASSLSKEYLGEDVINKERMEAFIRWIYRMAARGEFEKEGPLSEPIPLPFELAPEKIPEYIRGWVK